MTKYIIGYDYSGTEECHELHTLLEEVKDLILDGSYHISIEIEEDEDK